MGKPEGGPLSPAPPAAPGSKEPPSHGFRTLTLTPILEMVKVRPQM